MPSYKNLYHLQEYDRNNQMHDQLDHQWDIFELHLVLLYYQHIQVHFHILLLNYHPMHYLILYYLNK